MPDRYAPKASDKFTFGLWTTANPGRDPFGEPTRPPLDPIKNIRKMAEIGAWGFNFHDNDLIPFGATPQEHARIVRAAKLLSSRNCSGRVGAEVTKSTIELTVTCPYAL